LINRSTTASRCAYLVPHMQESASVPPRCVKSILFPFDKVRLYPCDSLSKFSESDTPCSRSSGYSSFSLLLKSLTEYAIVISPHVLPPRFLFSQCVAGLFFKESHAFHFFKCPCIGQKLLVPNFRKARGIFAQEKESEPFFVRIQPSRDVRAIVLPQVPDATAFMR